MNPNGGDLERRVTRIEQLIEILTNRHIDYEEDHARLLKAQVIMNDQLQLNAAQIRENTEQIRKNSEQICKNSEQIGQLNAGLDQLRVRVDSLVSAIGELVRRMPPQQQRP